MFFLNFPVVVLDDRFTDNIAPEHIERLVSFIFEDLINSIDYSVHVAHS